MLIVACWIQLRGVLRIIFLWSLDLADFWRWLGGICSAVGCLLLAQKLYLSRRLLLRWIIGWRKHSLVIVRGA